MSQTTVLADMSPVEILTFIQDAGGQRAAARQLGIPRTTVQYAYHKAREEAVRIDLINNPDVVDAPKDGVLRFILTSAQDSTPHHKGFLKNLCAYAHFMDAELLISGFTYNKSLFEDHAKESGVYDAALRPFMTNRRLHVADKVAFCAEMNISPTAANPLTGLQPYTKHMTGIVPHAKVMLESVSTMKHEDPKFMLTTGCITYPNYVPKKAGLKAEFHHEISAVILEVTPNGNYFFRYLHSERDGSFQDVDVYVSKGRVQHALLTANKPAEGLQYGDTHIELLAPEVARGAMGIETSRIRNRVFTPARQSKSSETSLLHVMRPKYQFIHDVLNMTGRNHHNIKDPDHMYEMWLTGQDLVFNECLMVADHLNAISQPWTKTIVVESNHDLALQKWLKSANYRDDPPNARFMLRCEEARYAAMDRQDKGFSIFEHVCRMGHGFMAESQYEEGFEWYVQFLREDEPGGFKICGDIECSMHGHLGQNGARGSKRTFAMVGPKSNTGHVHGPFIYYGAYGAGVSAQMDMGYNKGLGNWAWAHILTYQSGKRTLIIHQGEDWRAPRPLLPEELGEA